MDVAAGTITLFSDIGCPWSHACVYRLLSARERLGLDDQLVIEHRAYPLELLNEQPTPRSILDAEMAVVGGMEPDAGWRMWQAPDAVWPVTTLPALEAVQAAKEQSLEASEALDRALRLALYRDSRCVSMHHVVLEVAGATDGVDAELIGEALSDGRARHWIFEDLDASYGATVQGSPHVFLPDGSHEHNPGVAKHWSGDPQAGGIPVVDRDEPGIYEELLQRAVAA